MTQDNNNDDSTIHVYSSALEMAAAIRTGTITSRELVEQHIARIERLDHWKINAVVLRDFDAARAQADKADEMVRNGESLLLGPFHGVPLTLKESIFTPNFKTTMGDPKFWVPPGAHSETARLMMEDGGAILMGKTNLCKNALDWESNNPIYGATSNPFDTTKSPGGSSGGAAAALAAGFTPLEVGTDLGGSVRIPAAMNGVVGHCATRGIVPAPNPVFHWPCCGGFATRQIGKMLDELLWMARAGPLARTVPDVQAMLQVLGGDRAASLPQPTLLQGLKGARVGIWRSHSVCPPGKEVSNALDLAVAALKAAGANVEELQPPMDPMATYLIYLRFLGPITGAFMTEEQKANVRKGCPQDSYPKEMKSPYWEFDVSAIQGVPKGNVEAYHKAMDIWDKFLKDHYDAVLCPVFSREAWPKESPPYAVLPDHKTGARKFTVDDDEDRYYGDNLFWAHLSVLCGFPATSFPVCRTKEHGLPVGLQAFGCRESDFVVLDVVQKLTQQLQMDQFEPPHDFSL